MTQATVTQKFAPPYQRRLTTQEAAFDALGQALQDEGRVVIYTLAPDTKEVVGVEALPKKQV